MAEIATLLTHIRRPFRRRTDPGAVPGIVVPEPGSSHPRIRVLQYNAEQFAEWESDEVAQLAERLDDRWTTWVNVEGLGNATVIQQIGNLFGLHPLSLEDVVNTHQRPKVEEYENYLFIVGRMVTASGCLEAEQLSLFLGKNFLITFQEREADCLVPVRERLTKRKDRLRETGPDYLAYAVLDAVIDAYFPILEEYGQQLDALDDAIAARPAQEEITALHRLRGDLLIMRRHVWSHREAINALLRDRHHFVSDETRIYLRDCYDHTIQLIDVSEVYREVCADLREFYFSVLSMRTNEIMKVLTVIATIFMPLSFIAGVYGMNFEFMPELRWRYGYPAALSLMLAVACGMLGYMWRRGWMQRP